MTYGDVLAITFVHVGLLVAFQAYWLVAGALFPKMTRSAERNLTQRPIRTWLTGVAVAIPVFLLFAISHNESNKASGAQLKALSAGLALLAGMLGMFGVAGLTRRVGAGLLGEAALRERPGLCAFRGGLVLSFTYIMPFLGWFIVLPTTLVAGLGAVAYYVLIDRRKARDEESDDDSSMDADSIEIEEPDDTKQYESVI